MNFLQLIAADCLLIASKMRQNLPISINTLCYYTDHSISPCQLRVSKITAKYYFSLVELTISLDHAVIVSASRIQVISVLVYKNQVLERKNDTVEFRHTCQFYSYEYLTLLKI